jgi:hypothetical protein
MAKWNTTPSAFLALALALAAPAWARAAAPDDAALLEELPAGSSLESRLDADIDGDGILDVAFVAGNGNERWLVVKPGSGDGGFGQASVNHNLDHPLGPASLSVGKHVLLVEDLTGGSTATATTYRYRFDPAAKRMRLIGIDAERYSRTFSHDSLKIGWNLLTGDFVLVRSILNQRPAGRDNAAYRYTNPERTIRKSNPVYMEDTPNPDDLIDAEAASAGEDRD